MDQSTFQLLLSPVGQDALQAASLLSPREEHFLLHYQSLSKHYPPDLARLALETAILRRQASTKFPFADKLYLTRQSLEQASSHEVSSYRAERFRPFPYLADLGCSIGCDTFSLSKIAPTIGLDCDPQRLAIASANLHALGLAANTQLVLSDLSFPLPFKSSLSAMFFDPARRSSQHRYFSVEQYQPPLSIIKHWLPACPALGVKISPGIDLSELVGYDAEVEFISLRGELKEAVLWFGPFKSTIRRATILPGPYQITSDLPDQSVRMNAILSRPGSFVYEPDPAVIRAGLVTTLAEILNASQLDPDIAYLTSDALLPTPYTRAWQVEDWFPFQLKRLRSYLRQHNIGRVTVKKRGSPLEPEFLIQQLRLKGDQECILVLTHLVGNPIVIICKRV